MAKIKHIWVFNPNKTLGITWLHSSDPSVLESLMTVAVVMAVVVIMIMVMIMAVVVMMMMMVVM